MKRILKISKLLKLPTLQIVEALGNMDNQLLIIATATDIETLAEIYKSAPVGSRKREVALVRWEARSFQEAQLAQTIPKLQKVCFGAPDDGTAEDFAYEKWNILSLREVEAAHTIKKLKRALKRSPAGSEAERLAILKTAIIISMK